MSSTIMRTPAARFRWGLARVEVTPPVGIYHRVWGAARHDRATGIHRALYADVLVCEPAQGEGTGGRPLLRVQLDLVGLVHEQHAALRDGLAQAAGVPCENVVVAYNHSHSAGWFVPDRLSFPGGELIPAYLESLQQRLVAGCRLALATREEVIVSYATGRCAMAANRDYWDEARGAYVCGLNPDVSADDTLVVGRVTHISGRLLATLVHYACHPTTLAFQNTLLSPDFVGAARETVERANGAPCVYLQGCCGDLAPREGYSGDTALAESNGRQVGQAALAALEGLGPAGTDLLYRGPLVSGATLGIWERVAWDAERQAEVSRFSGGAYKVQVPLQPALEAAEYQRQLEEWNAKECQAIAHGDQVAAREAGAQAERARRWLARLRDRPPSGTYALGYTVLRLGDSLWVTTGGEPYNWLQRELRRTFPEQVILPSPLAGDLQVAYILPRERYGVGLYQEDVSSLGPGSLEALSEAITGRIAALG
jgi:hypothetical protein